MQTSREQIAHVRGQVYLSSYFQKSIQGIFRGVDCIHIAGMDELGM